MGVAKKVIIAVGALLMVFGGSACSKTTNGAGSSPSGATTTASGGATATSSASQSPKLTAVRAVTVTVDSSGFHPKTQTVSPGTNVVWVAGDDGPHVIASGTPGHGDTKFPKGPSMKKGSSFTVVLQGQGTYPFFDESHPESTGQIVVSGNK